jgi:hypothetical protein
VLEIDVYRCHVTGVGTFVQSAYLLLYTIVNCDHVSLASHAHNTHIQLGPRAAQFIVFVGGHRPDDLCGTRSTQGPPTDILPLACDSCITNLSRELNHYSTVKQI